MIKFLCKSLAFFLVVALLTSRLGTYSHEMFVEPIQEFISQTAAVYDDASPQGKTSYILKVKKLLSDIANLEQLEISTVISPALETEVVLQKFTMPPAVYLDILVPPDESSPLVS